LATEECPEPSEYTKGGPLGNLLGPNTPIQTWTGDGITRKKSEVMNVTYQK